MNKIHSWECRPFFCGGSFDSALLVWCCVSFTQTFYSMLNSNQLILTSLFPFSVNSLNRNNVVIILIYIISTRQKICTFNFLCLCKQILRHCRINVRVKVFLILVKGFHVEEIFWNNCNVAVQTLEYYFNISVKYIMLRNKYVKIEVFWECTVELIQMST